MERLKLPTDTVTEMLQLHGRCEREALELFMERAFPDGICNGQAQFMRQVEALKAKFFSENERVSRAVCEATLRDLTLDMETPIQDGSWGVLVELYWRLPAGAGAEGARREGGRGAAAAAGAAPEALGAPAPAQKEAGGLREGAAQGASAPDRPQNQGRDTRSPHAGAEGWLLLSTVMELEWEYRQSGRNGGGGGDWNGGNGGNGGWNSGWNSGNSNSSRTWIHVLLATLAVLAFVILRI